MLDENHITGRVLVVEDNRMNRLLLIKGLEQQGHQVESAENGREALEILKREPFDLVLLDIEMPEMNGFEVLEVMTQDPILRNIPVIIVSAGEEMDSAVKCIEMGAEDYLYKPPNPVLLRARVNASLEKKRLRDQQRRLFKTFTNDAIADELLAKGFSLGGKHIKGSAMFCDVRDFTSIAESQDPEETIALLNKLYAIMFECILSNNGIVNQIQGDGLLAIFGAPVYQHDHAEHSVRAAIEIQQKVALFNAGNAAKNIPNIRIGIGIASGRMVAGFAGTQARATYTCIGDTVNLAARLEAHTKVAHSPILIDEFTKKALPPDIHTRMIGPETFKGKSHAVNVFSVEIP